MQKAVVTPILKKGNIKDCENYTSICLTKSGHKIFLRIINNKLEADNRDILSKEQNDFCKGRSCADDYFTLKFVNEEHKEFNREIHIAYIDYKKSV